MTMAELKENTQTAENYLLQMLPQAHLGGCVETSVISTNFKIAQ
jgi:hypothetical protein